ncbi:hypothetical protein [Sphingomonas crocodyli]|uniref:HNH endonuclease n=1 Tax=Sphingomonas crocodyli TaxID=1979270 RepID=A0A437M880_9SPHN|nr:hypothetical protein [Sphingomonas crocodyli]RVT93704.1 hypothetical protein EOD43_07515 [Sphingomonas crocodyli]
MAKRSLFEILGGVTRFGRLTVLAEAELYETSTRSYRMALCRCDCGAMRSVSPWKLTKSVTVSCGCYAAERASRENRTHGMTGSRTYRSWQAMRNRCFKATDISYPSYGGRGITVCAEWRHSFDAFYRDMGHRPPGMTLDRIDGRGNYEPGNCRWATPFEQADNTIAAHKIEVAGELINVSEAARRSGLSRSALLGRIDRGLAPETAMTMPIDRTQGSRNKSNNRYVTYQGRSMLMIELCEETGLTSSHINYHMKQGRTADEAVGIILAGQAADKDKCPLGHPLSGDNLYVSPSRPGRQCRKCRNMARARSRAKRRAQG